jgi:protease I
MPDPRRRVLYVIAPEGFRDEELAEPQRVLAAAGHRIEVVSTRPGVARGMLGARVTVGRTLAQVDPAGVDLVVVAGGAGAPVHLWDHDPLRALVSAVHRAGRPVAAICLAPAVLARAGLLAGRRATTFPVPRAILELRPGGAAYVAEAVVRDGTGVTASGPEAAAAFGAAVAALVGS